MPSRRQHGALSSVNGVISTGATWYEDIEITDDDTFITNANAFEWRFMFREVEDETIALTLSTTDATLTVVQGASATTIQIRVDPADMSALDGDYIADLASQDGDDRIILWAHGTVTFRNEPVWS